MKSFKQHLEEAQAGFNTKDMIFTNADTPALILSPTALERAFGALKRIKAWHVTDLSGLKGLIKLQGKKSSISVLTEIEPSDHQPFEGIETGGGFVVELEGTELLSHDKDAWSERLEGGRRAIHISKGDFPSMFRHMELMVKKMHEKYHNIMIKKSDYEESTYATYVWPKHEVPRDSKERALAFNGLGQSLSQKEKGQFIKEYIDNCESILKKNKMGQKELRKYGRAKIKGEGQHYYNESVVNQISIKNVYVVLEKWEQFGRVDWGSEGDDELKYIKTIWKDVQMKSQKELVTLVNKK